MMILQTSLKFYDLGLKTLLVSDSFINNAIDSMISICVYTLFYTCINFKTCLLPGKISEHIKVVLKTSH